MAGETKKFLDLTGLGTFLNNIKYNYAQGSAGYIPLKASQLETARTIILDGDVTGSVSFDGSQNVTITTTAALGDTNIIENVGWKQSGASSITWLTPSTQDSHDKAVVLDLSGYALKSEIAAALNFKGSDTGANLASLTASDVSNGDVYSCTSDSGTFHAGYEYAAILSGDPATLSWVELGKYLDLGGYVEKTQKVNNKALSGDITLDGSDVALSSGYAVASTAAAPAAGDSIDVAVGKLQKEVADANAAATTYTFAEGSTDGAFQVTPTVGGVAGSAQSVAIHGLGSAAYADTTDFVDASLTPAEAGAQVNVIETVKVNGSALTPDANKAVDITIPAATVTDVQVKGNGGNAYASVLDGTVAKVDLSGYALTTDLPTVATAIADNDSGYATGDQVYDYVEANKGDENVIEVVKFKGNGDASASALTVDSSDKSVTVDVSGYALSTDLPTQATAVADGDTGYATGDQVYDYIDGMAIPDATIEALFPANPSSGS